MYFYYYIIITSEPLGETEPGVVGFLGPVFLEDARTSQEEVPLVRVDLAGSFHDFCAHHEREHKLVLLK